MTNAKTELELPKELINQILDIAPAIPNPVDPVTNSKRIEVARAKIAAGHGLLGVEKEANTEGDFISADAPRFLYTLKLQKDLSEMLGLGKAGLPISEKLYNEISGLIQPSQ